MSRAANNHPGGFRLTFKGNTMIAIDDEGNSDTLPIGSTRLKELGLALLTLADKREEHFNSERAGAVIGNDLINELLALRGKPQREAFRAIQNKLYSLSKLEHFDGAAGGFAGAVVNVLEIGVANLPMFEREGC